MSQSDQDRERRAVNIAHLNDRLRLAPGPGWMMTSGLQAKGVAFVVQAVAAVGTFNDFPPDNDPYGERDFGAFELAGERLFCRKVVRLPPTPVVWASAGLAAASRVMARTAREAARGLRVIAGLHERD
jgi:hypothetical protein